ncbi:MAG: ABC transporter substrate-binding protein [Peptostreptococcaceae bacterium]|nr:ABC transporter substrate-binding protein [Peptostreptococcaceae bacterium]
MKKLLALLLVVSMIFTMVACEKSATKTKVSSDKSDTTYSVTDSRGKTVTFNKTPEKIISLLPSDTEIVYALGFGDKLIAVSKYCNYPSDTENKKKIASGSKTSIESIIAEQPDLVIFGKMAQTEDQFNQVEDAGINVIVTEAASINDTYLVIEMLGKVLGASEKSAEVINGMKKDFNDIKTQVAGKPSYKVYVEISPVIHGPWSCGKGTFQDELLTLVGAENIFYDMDGWKKVSEEQVISRNPDYIFATDMYSTPDPIAEIMGRTSWSNINAIKNNKVFSADADALTRPGPRLVDAAKELYTKIYE